MAISEPPIKPIGFFPARASELFMFSTPVPVLLTLKSQIQAEIGKILKEMLQKASYENAFTCFYIRIGNDDHHLPNVILK